MKETTIGLDNYLTTQITKPIRCKKDLILILLLFLKLFLIKNTLTDKETTGTVKIIVDKMNRVFFFSENKYFSFNFPFKLDLSNEDNIKFYYNELDVNLKIISILEALLDEEDLLLLHKENIREYYYEYIEDDYEIILEEDFINLVNKIIEFEPGYIRYDYDDEHNNGNLLHPLNHLDVNFESNSTFKLGLNKKLKLEEFIDVMNINTDCHFLSGERKIICAYENILRSPL